VTASRTGFRWLVAVSAALGLATAANSLVIYSFGPLLNSLNREFGWSRGDVSMALTGYLLGNILLMPLVGRVTDRFGSRILVLWSKMGLLLCFPLLALLTKNVLGYYIVFLGVALLGAGTSQVAYVRLVSHWFEENRGLALGLVLAGTGVGATVIPYLTSILIQEVGWRMACVILPALLFLLSFPFEWRFLRDNPATLPAPARTGAAPDTAASIPLRQAVRGRPCLVLGAAFFLIGVAFSAMSTHLIPLLTDHGASLQFAAMVQGSIGVSLLVGRIGVGYLLDRLFVPYLAIALLAGAIISIPVLGSGAGGVTAILCAVALGIAAGAEIDVLAYLGGRYFGLQWFGQIYGVLSALFLCGGTIGPYVFGVMFDHFGDYVLSSRIMTGLLIVAATLMATLPRYRRA
jgi:OFA family oxalate/formate antiporter-like MFS transporter